MVRTIHYCHLCNYKSDRRYDRDKHVQRKHATQSNSSLAAYGRAPAAMKHEINAPQPQVGNYSVTQNNEPDDEIDVEDEEYPNDDLSESDTDSDTDSEDENISDIIEDLRNTFTYINDLKKQYRKLLPQLNELNDKELKHALKSYAALEVSVLDERDGIDHEEYEANNEDDGMEDDDEEGGEKEEDDGMDADNEEEDEDEQDEDDGVEDDGLEDDIEEGGEEVEDDGMEEDPYITMSIEY